MTTDERLEVLEDRIHSLHEYLQTIEHMIVGQGEMIVEMQKFIVSNISLDVNERNNSSA